MPKPHRFRDDRCARLWPRFDWAMVEIASAGQEMVVLRKWHARITPDDQSADAVAPEVHVVQQYISQGIRLNDWERASILRGRDEGVGTVKTILDQTIPGFAPNTRLKYANEIVDALLDASVSAQLSREAPSVQDQAQQEVDKLNAVLRAPSPSLLQQIPVGVSVTVHFDSIFSGRR
jgi:hypothetical protein